MDRLLAVGSLGALLALSLALRRRGLLGRSLPRSAKEESLEVSTWEEATLVAVLSRLLLDALGPESCRLQCLCRGAQLGRLELRQLFQEFYALTDWSGELCLAKLTSEEQNDVERTMRRAVAVATLAGRSEDLWRPDAGRPALVVAACSRPKARSQQLLRALLQQRAQPEARSPDGWNALMWSAQRGNCDDCRLLLEARASANAVSADGTSPLLCAVRADVAPLQVVKLLLTYKADPALVPMQSPFDEYVDMDVREALASAPKQR